MGGSKKYEGNANMTTAHNRLAKEMGMRMEHFDIVQEHIGGALRDLDVSEVHPFTIMAISSLLFHHTCLRTLCREFLVLRLHK